MNKITQKLSKDTRENNKCVIRQVSLVLAEEGAMNELKTEIVSYLFSQRGILPYLMVLYPALGARIATWATRDRPLLIIGGEPGNGKSLLMGELVLRYNELAIRSYVVPQPPMLISYDRIHFLFLKRLAQVSMPSTHKFLPEGETHPEARALITDVIGSVLFFALHLQAQYAPIILETPLIDHRGEDLIQTITALNGQMQIFIMHSPTMRMRALHDEKRRSRISAHRLAMQKIHEVLLRQRGVMAYPQAVQDDELARSWEKWLGSREGMVLSWNPHDTEDGFMHTKGLLEAMHIRTDPLAPTLLEKYALCMIELALKTLPDLEAFAHKVQAYGR